MASGVELVTEFLQVKGSVEDNGLITEVEVAGDELDEDICTADSVVLDVFSERGSSMISRRSVSVSSFGLVHKYIRRSL